MNDNKQEDNAAPSDPVQVTMGTAASTGMALSDLVEHVRETWGRHLLGLGLTLLGAQATSTSVDTWRETGSNWWVTVACAIGSLSGVCLLLLIYNLRLWTRGLTNSVRLALQLNEQVATLSEVHTALENAKASPLTVTPVDARTWRVQTKLFDGEVYGRAVVKRTDDNAWIIELWIAGRDGDIGHEYLTVLGDTLEQALQVIEVRFVECSTANLRQTMMALSTFAILQPVHRLAMRTQTVTGFMQGAAAAIVLCSSLDSKACEAEVAAFWGNVRAAANEFNHMQELAA